MTQLTTMPVIRLGNAAAQSAEVAGHKAATLSRLLAEGFPVPPGFVVTAGAATSLTATGTDEVLVAALEMALKELGGRPVAVRSSGMAEDLADASFAGQYESVLGVTGLDGMIEALHRCLASAGSARVASYSGGLGAESPMAVLIQAMLQPEAAGVAFTANPITGDSETVISAVRGLGERLVGGEVTPDDWVVRAGRATCLAAPEGAIDATQAMAIAELAGKVETILGMPQDVEWAIAEGRLHLLQARPITALPRPPSIEVPTSGYWMKDNTHYPMPLTPFGASVYLQALDAGAAPMCDAYGLLMEGFEQRSLGGEAYMQMIPLGGKERKPPPWWVMWLVSRLMPLIRRKERAAAAVLETDLCERLFDRWDEEWRPHFVEEVRRLRSRDLTSLDDTALLAHLDETLALLVEGEEVHFVLWPAYGLRLHDLAATCFELLGWNLGQVLDLVGGTSTASSDPGRALSRLAAQVASSPPARAVIDAGGADVADRLHEADPMVAAAFAEYVEEHGHRTMSYDPGDATLAERPELIAGFIRDEMASTRNQAASPSRDEAVERARADLAGHPEDDRDRFEQALAAAERAYPVREDNVIWTDNMPAGLIRYTAVEIGRRLKEKGMLQDPEDVVFLEEGEARSALLGDGGDLRTLLRRRRAERAWVATHPGPDSYGPEPPPPDLRGLTPALRRMTELLLWFISTGVLQLDTHQSDQEAEGRIIGVAGSPGRHTGTARVIRDPSEFTRLRRGEVLVCPITSPAWSVLFSQAGAVVTDGGSVLAHAAVIAREYAIPAVLATGDATRRIPDGALITVDGGSGLVIVEQKLTDSLEH